MRIAMRVGQRGKREVRRLYIEVDTAKADEAVKRVLEAYEAFKAALGEAEYSGCIKVVAEKKPAHNGQAGKE